MTCGTGKVCYPTRADAGEKLEALRGKRGHAIVYYCDACVAFHISTKKKGKPYDRASEKRKWAKKRF